MPQIQISKLKPNPKNPRRITEESMDTLRNSIEQLRSLGKHKPIIIDEDNVILAGNQRYAAYNELGIKKVHISRFTKKEYDEEVKNRKELGTYNGETYEDLCDEIMIKDNISAGQWEWEMLHQDYDENKLMEFGLEGFGGHDFDPEKFFKKQVEFNASAVHKLTLEFSEEQFNFVTDELEKRGGSKEEIIISLLKL